VSKHARHNEDVTPNLIPIMNLFTALIPFLLMSAVFYQLSMIPVSVPVASSTGDPDVTELETKVTLSIRIHADRYELSASSATVPEAELAKLTAVVPRTQGDSKEAILAEVSRAAYRIKGTYDASDTVIVVPSDDTPYEVIVDTLDAVRELRIQRDGARAYVSLFPRVVLSSEVQ